MTTGKENIHSLYPLTVIADRYSGSYSRAAFLAFNTDYDNIPTAINAVDNACGGFWIKYKDTLLVGKGNTVNEAIDDLISKMKHKDDFRTVHEGLSN